MCVTNNHKTNNNILKKKKKNQKSVFLKCVEIEWIESEFFFVFFYSLEGSRSWMTKA